MLAADPTDTLLTACGDQVVFAFRDTVSLHQIGGDWTVRRLDLPGIARRRDPERALGVSWVACVIHPVDGSLVWCSERKVLCRTTLGGEVLATSPELSAPFHRLAHSADGRHLVASGGAALTTLYDAATLRPLTSHGRSSTTRAPFVLPHAGVVAMPNHGTYTVRPIARSPQPDPAIFGRPPAGADAIAVSPNGARYAALVESRLGSGFVVRFGADASGPDPGPCGSAREIAIADDGTLALYSSSSLTLLLPSGQRVEAPRPSAPIARVAFVGGVCLVARVDGLIEVVPR